MCFRHSNGTSLDSRWKSAAARPEARPEAKQHRIGPVAPAQTRTAQPRAVPLEGSMKPDSADPFFIHNAGLLQAHQIYDLGRQTSSGPELRLILRRSTNHRLNALRMRAGVAGLKADGDPRQASRTS